LAARKIGIDMTLSYCDYIAHLTASHLLEQDVDNLLLAVGPVKFDLNDDGSYKSSKKEVRVMDMQKQVYKITIEELK
jgi:hypothetical protein